MKILLIIITTLVLQAIAAFFILGFMSKSGEAKGLVEGRELKATSIIEVPVIATKSAPAFLAYMPSMAISVSAAIF